MAKYNGKNPIDNQRATVRVQQLIKKGAFFEIREITNKSLSQNNYFHLIVSYFAVMMGYDLFHAKQIIVKQQICADTFEVEKVNRVTGEIFTSYRSFSELNKEEVTHVIDKFINYVAKNLNIRLPDPTDLIYSNEIREMEKEIENNKEYL